MRKDEFEIVQEIKKMGQYEVLKEINQEIEGLAFKQRPFTWDDTGEKGTMDIRPSIEDIKSIIQNKIKALEAEAEKDV